MVCPSWNWPSLSTLEFLQAVRPTYRASSFLLASIPSMATSAATGGHLSHRTTEFISKRELFQRALSLKKILNGAGRYVGRAVSNEGYGPLASGTRLRLSDPPPRNVADPNLWGCPMYGETQMHPGALGCMPETSRLAPRAPICSPARWGPVPIDGSRDSWQNAHLGPEAAYAPPAAWEAPIVPELPGGLLRRRPESPYFASSAYALPSAWHRGGEDQVLARVQPRK